jgi:hypothetical protein
VEEEKMLANSTGLKAPRSHGASLVFSVGLAVVLLSCGTTASQQSLDGPRDFGRDSDGPAEAAQISAGSFSLDFDTANHVGRIDVGAGSFLLDYDTAMHMGRLDVVPGSFSLDYDTARHMGRLDVSVTGP